MQSGIQPKAFTKRPEKAKKLVHRCAPVHVSAGKDKSKAEDSSSMSTCKTVMSSTSVKMESAGALRCLGFSIVPVVQITNVDGSVA